MIALKLFVFVILISSAYADYLECYVCEDCEETEGHYEYCTPLENLEIAGGETETAVITTVITHTATGDDSVTNKPVQPTTATATRRPASVNTAQTTVAAMGSSYTNLTNSTSTILSTEPIELTTVEEALVNELDLVETTISSQLTTLAAVDSTLSTLDATEAIANIESTAGNISEPTVPGTTDIDKENAINFETESIESLEGFEVNRENSTFLTELELESTAEAGAQNVSKNITSTEMVQGNVTTSLGNLATADPEEIGAAIGAAGVGQELFTSSMDMFDSTASAYVDVNVTDVLEQMESSKEVLANTIAFAGPSESGVASESFRNMTTTSEANDTTSILELDATALGVSNNITTTVRPNSTTQAEGADDTTGILELDETKAGVSNNNTNTVRLNSTTQTEGADNTTDIRELDEAMAGVSNNITTSGRPTSTTQIGIYSEVLENTTTTERPYEPVGIGLTGGNSLSSSNSEDLYLNATEELVNTGSTNTTPTRGPNDMEKGEETGSETGPIIESPMPSLVEINSTQELSGINGEGLIPSTASGNLQNATTAEAEPTGENSNSAVESVNLTNSAGTQLNAIDVVKQPEATEKDLPAATNVGRPNATAQLGLESESNGNIEVTDTVTTTTTGVTVNSTNSTNSEVVQLNAADETKLMGTVNGVLVNFTDLGSATFSAEIGQIASENTTTVQASNLPQESNEIEFTSESSTGAAAAMNSTDEEVDLLNVADSLERPGTTDGFLNNTPTASEEPNTTLHIAIGNESIELNTTTEANKTAVDLHELDGTPHRNTSLTPAVPNANDTIENVITAASLEGLLDGNSGEFVSVEANGTPQAEDSSLNLANPTTGNFSLIEDSVSEGYSNLETDENFTDALSESAEDKLVRSTFKRARVPRAETSADNEALSPKSAAAAPVVQRTAIQPTQKWEFRQGSLRGTFSANPTHFSPHKYAKISNAAGMKLGNITYKCYTVRVKGKNKLQINKGCVAVPAEKTACELLADRYGVEALEDCAVCPSGKCNRSYGNRLAFSKLSLALLTLIGWLLRVLLC